MRFKSLLVTCNPLLIPWSPQVHMNTRTIHTSYRHQVIYIQPTKCTDTRISLIDILYLHWLGMQNRSRHIYKDYAVNISVSSQISGRVPVTSRSPLFHCFSSRCLLLSSFHLLVSASMDLKVVASAEECLKWQAVSHRVPSKTFPTFWTLKIMLFLKLKKAWLNYSCSINKPCLRQ